MDAYWTTCKLIGGLLKAPWKPMHHESTMKAPYCSNFELVFVSRNPPDSSKEICYGDLVTEIL